MSIKYTSVVNSLKKFQLLGISIIAIVFISIGSAQSVSALKIDFETGFTEGDMVGTINVIGNSVTFQVGTGSPMMDGLIAEAGFPERCFQNNDNPEPGAPGAVVGDFFLCDESMGPSATEDYFIEWANPIASLELDLIDFRQDGGPEPGDVATLTAYSDTARTMAVGTATRTVLGTEPDGNVEHLAILLPSAAILAADLTWSGAGATGGLDTGTAIDNIEFENLEQVGGHGGVTSNTALLLSGSHLTGSWMIPLIVSAIGIGVFVFTRK